MLSFPPYTFDCYVRLFSGFFHKHKLCRNTKFSINCVVYHVSNPSPKHIITLVLIPIKGIRKSEFTCFKLAYPLDGLGLWSVGIAYKISLLRDATQPGSTSKDDDSHARVVNKGIAVRGRCRICLLLLGTNTYLQANLRGAKMLRSKERPGPPREGHQSARFHKNTACPICTMQWEHLSHALKKKLKNAPFNPTHLCPGCSTVLFASFSWGLI